MYCESCSEPIETQSVVRQHNRVLRSVIRTLRKRVRRGDAAADALFVSLCETNPAAEQAMRRLWEEGGFQPPCRPEDYEYIVDVSIRALRAYRETAETPAQSLPDPDWQRP